jgi:hypothetical protein
VVVEAGSERERQQSNVSGELVVIKALLGVPSVVSKIYSSITLPGNTRVEGDIEGPQTSGSDRSVVRGFS